MTLNERGDVEECVVKHKSSVRVQLTATHDIDTCTVNEHVEVFVRFNYM